MVNLNRITIIGNVGKEVELRYSPQGTPIATFSVAVNNKYTNKNGEPQEETEWFNIVAWSKLAETLNQFIRKGQQVYVEGRQKTRQWDDQNGQKHWRTELMAQRVLFLGKKDITHSEPIKEPDVKVEEGTEPEDLPF